MLGCLGWYFSFGCFGVVWFGVCSLFVLLLFGSCGVVGWLIACVFWEFIVWFGWALFTWSLVVGLFVYFLVCT